MMQNFKKKNVLLKIGNSSEKGKENRKGADARFRANHREERNEYSRNYYQAHKEYFAEYQKKYRARKAA